VTTITIRASAVKGLSETHRAVYHVHLVVMHIH